MEIDESLLAIPINLNNFPAKLWCLVNDPKTRSIRWDSRGEAVLIDQQLFEAELLSPDRHGQSPEVFKTSNFSSFIRQLNLYGFRKVSPVGGVESPGGGEAAKHHFLSPNFKRGHPELLVHLKRLTSSNKAKIKAGLEVNCRPPNRFHRYLLSSPENSSAEIKAGSVLAEQSHQGQMNPSPYRHHSNCSQQLKEYDQTPVPSKAWLMGHRDDCSSAAFYGNKGVPLSVTHHCPAHPPHSVPSSSTTVQQSSQGNATAGHKFGTFLHHSMQYQPGLYAPVCQCCSPGSFESEITCSHHPTASYPHYGYYPNYAVGILHPSSQNRDRMPDGTEPAKFDVSLDTVFKIVNELQESPRVRMVKVSPSEKRPTASASDRRPGGQSLHVSPACTSKVASGLDSAQHGFPGPQSAKPVYPHVNHAPTGSSITVPGSLSSDIAFTMVASLNQSKTGADRCLEQGSCQRQHCWKLL